MKQKSQLLDFVVGLLLFCLFTVSMLMVLISGANAYKNISAELDTQYGKRTCLSYIVTKVRHYDSVNEAGLSNVYISDFEGVNALSLAEEIDGMLFVTFIYCYEGYLYELFAAHDSGLYPEDGLQVMPVDLLSFEMVMPSLLKIDCVSGGLAGEQLVYLQSAPGKVGAER